MMIRRQNGYTLMEVVVALGIASLIAAATMSALSFLQSTSNELVHLSERDALARMIRSTISNRFALARSAQHGANRRFKDCFAFRSPASALPLCLSGETYGFTLVDGSGALIAGPDQDSSDTTSARPVFYSLSGQPCRNQIETTVRCPLAVVTSFRAQGFPDVYSLPVQTPPTGERQEFVEIYYNVDIDGSLLSGMQLQSLRGSVIFDINSVSL